MSERNSAANLEDGQPVEENARNGEKFLKNAENLENQPEDALQEGKPI
jgi:hypothetical protein